MPTLQKRRCRLPVGKEIGISRATRLTIRVYTALFVSLLGGCGPEPQAPSPAVNPHPHEFTKLKITVEPGAGVTGIRVESLWNVGNIGCAPHEGWPSGASITKQVNTPEKVDKTGTDEWVATVVDDRFLPDKCRWHGGGYGIHFMRDQGILSGVGTGKDELDLISTLKITCTYDEPHGWPGACFNRDQEASLKARQAQVFNATVEIMQ